MHLIKLEHGLVGDERLDRIEGRVPRPVTGRLHGVMAAFHVERRGRGLRPHGAGNHGEADQLHAILGVRDLLVDQRLDVLVVDVLLAIGERLEANEGVLELVARQVISELLELVHEGVGPECLPITSELCFTPTLSGVMISYVWVCLSMPSWWMPDSCA